MDHIITQMLWLLLAATTTWSYPMTDYYARQTQKGFAQYIDKAWYVGKEKQFPNQFTGYHTGVDLETYASELNQPVPVYAVTAGHVVFAGPVSGYGGVILFRPDSGSVTFLYGHVKVSGLAVGKSYSSGQTLTYLGDAFSSQTGGERKHLHFAIYRGTDNYFRGYESTLVMVNSRFLDPNQYFKDRIQPSPPPSPVPIPQVSSVHPIFFDSLLAWLKQILKSF